MAETIDSRISKLSLEELQSKLEEAQKTLGVYQAAIDERKQGEIQKHLDALKALGYGGSRAKGKAPQRKPASELLCPVCKIKGHDGRAHRFQGKAKKALTPEELKERNLPS